MTPTWQEIEPLLERLERVADPVVREDARALVGLLIQLHGDALARLVKITQRSGQSALFDAWKDDPQVNGLLLLHGLHPDDLASRVRYALAEVTSLAAFLRVELSIRHLSEEEVVIELAAQPDVPPEALAQLRGRIESAIVNQAPEVRNIRLEGGPRRFALPLLSR